MAARKTALVLSPETPYPLHGGGALRTASLLNYLARTHDVDLIVFRDRPQQDPARALPPGLVRRVQVVDLPRHRRDAPARLARNGWRMARGVPPLIDRFQGFQDALEFTGRYDVAVIEHFWCAAYQPALAKVSARVVLNLHNIESTLHETCARAGSGMDSFAHHFFARRCLRLEKLWIPKFDAVLTASGADAERVRRFAAAPPVIVYPNTIPFTPLPDRAEEDVIAFSGNLEYHPNRTAVQFFASKVWPRLSQDNPRLVWRLIGMNPQAIGKYIHGLPRVETTGPVADAVRELAAAKVVVAPLLSGSGTRLKIVEAWAAGRAVVSTWLGAEGLPFTNRENLVLADTPADLVKSIQTLLHSSSARTKLGDAGRYLYERELSWEAAWRTLNCSGFLADD